MLVNNWLQMQKEIESEASQFLMEAYGLELTVPVVINSRLKSVYGRFIYNATHKFPVRIEMSKNYIEHQEWEIVRQTILHECIHYALYVQNLPHKDGHPVFEAELKKWGSRSTGTVAYRGKVVEYLCTGCGHVYRKKKRYPRNRKYSCGVCSNPIKFNGEKVV